MAPMEEASKKRRQRRSYTDDFRAGAARLVLDEGKTVSRVAQDLDLTASALASWVKQARADRSNGKTGLTTDSSSHKSAALPLGFTSIDRPRVFCGRAPPRA
jgi:transposase